MADFDPDDAKPGCGCLTVAAATVALIVGCAYLGSFFFAPPLAILIVAALMWRAMAARASVGVPRGLNPKAFAEAVAQRQVIEALEREQELNLGLGLISETPTPTRPGRRRRAASPSRLSTDRRKTSDELDLGLILASGEDELRFTYADVHGEVTERVVVRWTEYIDHLQGYCVRARGHRTFRKDRVEEWQAETDRHLIAP